MFDKFRASFPKLDWDKYESYYHRVEVPAGTILLREGTISRKAFLIDKGCLRVWFNNNGKDVTFQFFFEGEIVSSGESFRKKIPSYFTIEAIEPSVLHWIHKKDLDKIFNDISEIPELRNNMIDIAFERQFHYMRHFLSFIRDTPMQRYLELLKEKPHIIQRVPHHYVATYLGITPVSLSRIRKRVGK
ncbi:MAG: Crp/Fnr family transcriptional regulator [Bacteroidota bacterium]